MRIEILSGSPRQNSVTRRVALHLKAQLEATTNHEIGLIDLREWQLPPMEAVIRNAASAPESMRPLAERIFAADAFILVTPEYNGSYAPALKNLLDYFPKQHHKAFGVVTASPGAMGGMRASQQLLLLVPALFGIASPYMLVVPGVDKKFDENGSLLDPAFANAVHNFLAEFIWLGESLAAKQPEVV